VERISLLPPELKKARQEKEKRRKIQHFILLFLVWIAVMNIFFLVTNLLLRSNLESLQVERKAIEFQTAGLSDITELQSDINSSEQLLIAAMGTVPQWSTFLRSISQTRPVTAWFADLTAVYSDQAATLEIRGWSYDHGSLADLLESLEEMEQLEQVQCRVSTETIYQNTEAIQFQIDAILLPGPGFLAEEGGFE